MFQVNPIIISVRASLRSKQIDRLTCHAITTKSHDSRPYKCIVIISYNYPSSILLASCMLNSRLVDLSNDMQSWYDDFKNATFQEIPWCLKCAAKDNLFFGDYDNKKREISGNRIVRSSGCNFPYPEFHMTNRNAS